MQSRRDELKNNVEDARLALLMDEFCEEEGAKLLAESDVLNSDPDAAVPSDLHQRLQNTVDRHFVAEKRVGRKLAVRRVLKCVLIVAAIAATLFATAFAAVEDFRVSVMNMTLDVRKLYSELVITIDPPEKSDYISDLSEGPAPDTNFVFGDGRYAVWVPEGNEILEDRVDENSVFVYMESTTDESRIALYNSRIVVGMDFQVDTENADEIADIEINGNPGYLIRKGDRNHFIWSDFERGIIFELVTNGHPVATGFAIAESWSFVE